MSEAIYLLDKDGGLVQLTKAAYDSEVVLQELLAKYPTLLPGEQIDSKSPRRWLFIAREIGVPSQEDGGDRWSLDHLFIDQEGIPTLIEVKRSTDTRIRREVVGQMLDYAANVVSYWPIETIIAKFESACEQDGRDPDAVLADFLGGQSDSDFWEQAETNLRAGKVRMIFVADEIPDELRAIVEFLNAQMDPAEVIAIEVPQFVGQGLKTLVPRVYGLTAKSQSKKLRDTEQRQWDEDQFFTELAARNGQDCARIARDILDWIRPKATYIWWGKGQRSGSFIPVLRHGGTGYQFFAVWTYARVEIQFQWCMTKPPFDAEEKRLELLGKLNEIPGVSLPEDCISRRPAIPMEVLKNTEALERFKATFEWYIEQVQGL
jgi:hypothetical protein